MMLFEVWVYFNLDPGHFFNLIFYPISYFGVKLLILELCDSFTFLSIGLSRVQVNQVNLG